MKRIEIKVSDNVYYPTNPTNCLTELWDFVRYETWDKIDDTCVFVIRSTKTNLQYLSVFGL